MEIWGGNLRRTQESLEYETCDRHRQALLEGLGLREEMVDGAAVKREEIGREEEDEEMLEGPVKTRVPKFGGDAELHEVWTDPMCNTPRRKHARRWRI